MRRDTQTFEGLPWVLVRRDHAELACAGAPRPTRIRRWLARAAWVSLPFALACSGSDNASKSSGNVVTGPFEGTKSGIDFSVPRGIYQDPFELVLSHPTAASVRYTLDASDPRTSPAAVVAPLPLTLHIDPADTTHRFTAPAVIVRATVGDATALPESVATHTYLFLNRVVELSPDGQAPGAGWPEPQRPTGGGNQVMDYGMDPDVTNDPAYADSIQGALAALPAISLVTDLSNLFDPQSGIYVNGYQEGLAWERFGSVELLMPDNGPGFQANTGVRLRGGYSRRGEVPKHAFRLFFRDDYGTKKLKFSLFGAEGASSFDKIDLRTAQNYSWSMDGGADFNENVMVRDVFSRDLQREMGQPYTRSRYYHLYLDGVYWGLYQSQERAEARYAETYFGGTSTDYDVVKVERGDNGGAAGTNVIAATDGTLDTWQQVWTMSEAGFQSDSAYYALEGKGPDGQRDSLLPVLVNVDNLIDYMLVIFYTANFDGPCSKWFSNADPNNFFAIKNRVNGNEGFVFFAHDSEHTLMAEPLLITSGVTENRVSIGSPSGATDGDGNPSAAYQMRVSDFTRFHPQWLHFKLTENALYRARFAGRAHTVLDAGGLMTESRATELLRSRTQEIDEAIVAESARWGDAQRPNQPRTKNDDWIPAVNRVIEGFLGRRTPIVVEQLRAEGLY